MSRLLCFAVAMGLSTAAHAGSFSFTVGGQRISISAAPNCSSASCVSVSIPGIVISRRKPGDQAVAAQDAPPPEARATVAPPALPSPPPSVPKLAPTDSKQVTAPPPPLPAEPVAPPPAAAIPASDPAPVLKTAQAVDAVRDDTPLGDWQTEGKTGAVRIEACGKALCGYLIDPSSLAKAETILINMKPSSAVEWRGSIFSRASGNTYNATMTLRGANLLRVEACALGHFFCSGNDWTRVLKQPAALVTSRGGASEPRS